MEALGTNQITGLYEEEILSFFQLQAFSFFNKYKWFLLAFNL